MCVVQGRSRLAQRAQALGGTIERGVARSQGGQRLADHVHDVAGVGLVAKAASAASAADEAAADEAADLLLGEAIGDFHVLDEITLHGGAQLGVVVAVHGHAVGSTDEVVGHAIATPRPPPHAVRLHRDRDDARVLLRIGSVDLVADDRVEARECLVDEFLLHGQITSTGRSAARGAHPSSLK